MTKYRVLGEQREAFNKWVQERGNKLYGGLGDSLTCDIAEYLAKYLQLDGPVDLSRRSAVRNIATAGIALAAVSLLSSCVASAIKQIERYSGTDAECERIAGELPATIDKTDILGEPRASEIYGKFAEELKPLLEEDNAIRTEYKLPPRSSDMSKEEIERVVEEFERNNSEETVKTCAEKMKSLYNERFQPTLRNYSNSLGELAEEICKETGLEETEPDTELATRLKGGEREAERRMRCYHQLKKDSENLANLAGMCSPAMDYTAAWIVGGCLAVGGAVAAFSGGGGGGHDSVPQVGHGGGQPAPSPYNKPIDP